MAFLPPNIQLLFQARPPPPFLPPIEKPKLPPYSGLAGFLKEFQDPSNEDAFKYVKIDNIQEAKEKRKKEKAKLATDDNQEKVKTWDPYSNQHATGDPYKTLFIARISYQTTEKKLYDEFSQYGPIKNIRLVQGEGQEHHTGYAFIEYEKEKDMKTAYKNAELKKIDDRKILVDIERGRVIKNWKPRKYGGGLGKTRAGGDDVNQTSSHREMMEREKEKEREKQEMERRRASGLEHQGYPPLVTSRAPRSIDHEDRHHGHHPYNGGGRGGGRERERSRDRDGGRDYRDRDGGRDGGRDRERDREREHRDNRYERERDRDGGRDYRDRDRDRDGGRDRERDRERDRSRERYRNGGGSGGGFR